MDPPLNYTGHDIVVRIPESDTTVTFPSYGNARLTANEINPAGKLANGIQLVMPYYYDGMEGLPEDETTNIIVSDKLASRLKERGWLGAIYAPDTNEGSRISDEGGNVSAVQQLIVYQFERSVVVSADLPNLVFKHDLRDYDSDSDFY